MPQALLVPLPHALPHLALVALAALVASQPAATGADGPQPLGGSRTVPSPASDLDDAPSLAARALRDPAYLPAEIGAIFAAYGVSLVLVAITLLSLAKKRRQHLKAAKDELVFESPADLYSPDHTPATFHHFPDPARPARVPNFSYPSPIKTDFNIPASPHLYPSPTSTVSGPGVDLAVDQRVVQADREMAQQQLEEMYKHVLEHDEAKQRGVVLEAPVLPGSAQARATGSATPKKDKTKPANLNLGSPGQEKPQSKAHAFFSALRSPKKKSLKGVSISSPIMTPQSSTFSIRDSREMSAMTPRPYAPAPPTPALADQSSVAGSRASRAALPPPPPPPPDMSPQSVQSIDERISAQLGPPVSSRHASQATAELDPGSAVSMHSSAPSIGLPSSPKGGPRSPRSAPLPSSPQPGASFRRPNAPSAVRTGGTLPLRAYEPAMSSPSAMGYTTKQTVFERMGPLSPTTGRTPRTAGAVPYSPYQPHTPCIPVTPSLVTKEDRKRMKKMIPKTPTLEMVKSSEEMW
ncbi:hypothetical protein CDD83_7960 [Cordyceps sp. RAO-2017]|nr:hypothetical protein CDD83_7960 [Cordyceps sp. RAO-2017]